MTIKRVKTGEATFGGHWGRGETTRASALIRGGEEKKHEVKISFKWGGGR